jgi:hypothetical protein
MCRLPALAVLVVLFGSTPTQAQSLVSRLGTLLTEQRPSTPVFVPDGEAAAATASTVAGLFAVELSTLPLASSSGGFVYRVNPSLGLVERASDAFGPFFTERMLRNSRGQTSVGFSLQFSEFTALQGADLTTGTFPTNAARLTGATQSFSVDTLSLDLEDRIFTGFFSYGVTDRFAIGAAVPLVQVRFSGQRVRTVNGVSTLMSSQSGSAMGLGDLSIQGRYVLTGQTSQGVSIGGDLRLPTGRADDLLGAGDTAARVLGIGSWEENKLALHANAGFGVGGASHELFWSTASTVAVNQRVTVVGEIMGRRLSELSLVQDVYEPHPIIAGVETMRWLPTERGVHTMFVVAGAKWNLAHSLLLSTNVLIRVTDAGLRSRVTPAISLDYAFEQSR